MADVTFGQFAREAKKHGYTPESLASEMPWWDSAAESSLPGASESRQAFAKRLFSLQYSANILPYTPPLKLFSQWTRHREIGEAMSISLAASTSDRLCECGCGRPVFGRKRFFKATCRKRLARQNGKSVTLKNSPKMAA